MQKRHTIAAGFAAAILLSGAGAVAVAHPSAGPDPQGPLVTSGPDGPDVPGEPDTPEAGDTPDADAPDLPGQPDLPEPGDTPDP